MKVAKPFSNPSVMRVVLEHFRRIATVCCRAVEVDQIIQRMHETRNGIYALARWVPRNPCRFALGRPPVWLNCCVVVEDLNCGESVSGRAAQGSAATFQMWQCELRSCDRRVLLTGYALGRRVARGRGAVHP